MSDLRALLEREGERVSLPPDASDRMFERGRRRDRNRKVAALCVAAVLFVAVLVIVRSDLPNRRPEPARPRPITARSIAGTYAMRIHAANGQVDRLGLEGPYSIQLRANGSLLLIGPHKVDYPWNPATFEITRGVLRTDLFVGISDPDQGGCRTPATYSVEQGARSLTLTPIEEPCRFRATILAAGPWTAVSNRATGRFEGDWTTTFSCARMVRTVHEAAIAPREEAFWLRGSGELGSDPEDPCRGALDPITFALRFDHGRLLIYGPDGSMGFDGGYEVHGNIMTIRDAGMDNINGSYQLRFRLTDDRVSFHLLGRGATDPFFVATWESAPFLKNA